ncbi:MAG: hypothetical protein ACKVH0_17720 [Alphaproteobacteria bacterium]
MSRERAESLVEAIDIDPQRPLLIVDADEVLFHFMAAFLEFIESKGHAFIFRSYALTGNVLAHTDGPPLERDAVTALLQGFFAVRTRDIPPDPEAAPALARMALDGIQTVVLSNVPSAAADDRRIALAAAGISVPLAPWSGPKGEAVKALAAKTQKGAAFVDDIAHHHESVAEIAPDVYRLHYVTHPELRRLLGTVEAAHDQGDDWPALETMIRARLL